MKRNRKKNIGFVCTSFDNIAGGLERQIIRTSKSLNKRGFKVYIFSFDNYSAESFYEIPNEIIWVKCGNGLKPHAPADKMDRLKQILNLRKEFKKYHINTLITFHHGIFPRVYLASFLLNIKNIVSERNSLSNYKYIKLNKYNLGFFSLYLANKITIQLESYSNDYPFLLRKKIFVINNIIKKPLKSHKMPNIEQNIVSMAGRLCDQKNFTPLLNQLNFDKTKDLRIIIAGEGHLRRKLEKDYEDLIKESSLILKGNIKDIDKFLSNSSIFCFPSLWEGFPNSLAEALRMGMPIVTSTRMKYLNEFVEHNVNGLIVEDDNLLSSIKKLIKNKSKLISMSKESFRKYKELSKSRPVDEWVKLVELVNF